MNKKNIFDVIVIGMGASGLFAMANLSDKFKVLGIESQKTAGRKLLLTGGGRCNLTNTDEIKRLVGSYTSPSFVRTIIHSFNNFKIIEWFEKRGVPTRIEADKVYPYSQSSKSVLNLLLNEVYNNGHKINFEEKAISFENITEFFSECSKFNENEAKNYTEKLIKLTTDKTEYHCRKLIVATGGATYSFTGSDGAFAKNNFEINSYRPGLCQIFIEDDIFTSLAGLSLSKVRIKHSCNDSNRNCQATNAKFSYKRKSFDGEFLFTGRSLSGKVIMDFSNYADIGDVFTIDFLPNVKIDELRLVIKKVITANHKKLFKNLLQEVFTDDLFLPNALINLLLKQLNIENKQVSQIKKREISDVLDLIKNHKLKVKNKQSLDKAIVSLGGVKLQDIDNKTMSLKGDENIFVIGEALDVAGDCGGYSLTFAFSSAQRAVQNIRLKK